MHVTIERELEVQLVLSPVRSIPVPTMFRYCTADPYAVHLMFHAGSSAPVEWTFARELLVEGALRPAGHGDVRVWPGTSPGRTVIFLALSSPEGDALLRAPQTPVSAWLERTLRLVPSGTEGEAAGEDDPGWEEELRVLLAGPAEGLHPGGAARPSEESGEPGA